MNIQSDFLHLVGEKIVYDKLFNCYLLTLPPKSKSAYLQRKKNSLVSENYTFNPKLLQLGTRGRNGNNKGVSQGAQRYCFYRCYCGVASSNKRCCLRRLL